MIVDDNDRFLQVIRGVLERDGFEVAGVATDCTQAIARARELRPDVMLIDICLGDQCGFALAEQLAGSLSRTPVMILISTYAADEFTALVQTSPAAAFLSKGQLTGDAIRQVLDRTSR